MKRGRIEIIRKETNVINGRRQQDETSFYECWCEVQSLNTAEQYEALQTERMGEEARKGRETHGYPDTI